jgi:UDP:flavonoid glycosyltransferase YjiC (YdhE family)
MHLPRVMHQDGRMRVLFAAPGAYGHVHPMIALASSMQRAGHTVLWATSQRLCERLVAVGFDATPAGIEIETCQKEFRGRYPHEATLAPEERRLLMFPKLFGEIAASAMLPELLATTAEFRPDVVIHGAAEFASAIAAGLLGVPHVSHGFGALVPRDIVEAASREVEPLWASAGLEARVFGGCYEFLYLDIYPPGMQPFPLTHVPKVQALRPVASDGVDGDCLPSRLEQASPPIVYVTFGTVFNAVNVFAPVLDATAVLDATFVVTVGPLSDPAVLGTVPANVMVERYVPQSLLFDRCAAVVSHAGSGTFLGALAQGLPQVCLPQAADQFVNAAACERIGAGIALAPPAVTADAVAGALRRVLDDPTFRAGAAIAAATIASMPSPDEVVETIEQLL